MSERVARVLKATICLIIFGVVGLAGALLLMQGQRWAGWVLTWISGMGIGMIPDDTPLTRQTLRGKPTVGESRN